MAKFLNANEAIPKGNMVVILKRFDEQIPSKCIIECIECPGTTHTHVRFHYHNTGEPLSVEETIKKYENESREVFVIDRTDSPLAASILQHAGDHSFSSKHLDDFDLSSGDHGSDMRDIGHTA